MFSWMWPRVLFRSLQTCAVKQFLDIEIVLLSVERIFVLDLLKCFRFFCEVALLAVNTCEFHDEIGCVRGIVVAYADGFLVCAYCVGEFVSSRVEYFSAYLRASSYLPSR